MMCQWFGMIMTERTRGKVDANDRARHFLAQINSEIGSAKNVLIGTGSSTTFVPVGANLLQQGNAIQINSSTNTNQFIRYYRDAADQTVKRLTDQTSSPSIVASGVTNGLVFTAQDFTGTTLTNSQGNCVIGGTLNINELRAAAKMGVSNSYYASYTLKARIALRTTP